MTDGDEDLLDMLRRYRRNCKFGFYLVARAVLYFWFIVLILEANRAPSELISMYLSQSVVMVVLGQLLKAAYNGKGLKE